MATQTQRDEKLDSPVDIWNVLKDAAREFSDDKVPRLGAALAYYTAFSLAPLLVIAIGVAGLVFGEAAAREAVIEQLRGLMGEEGATFVGSMIENVSDTGSGIIATIIGVFTLALGALGAFGQLQDALNTIWEVRPKPGLGLLAVIRKRLLSLSMVLVIGFFLMVALVVSAALSAINTFISGVLPFAGILAGVLNFAVSFGAITVLFALMFKYLPDAVIAWRDVWIGAAVTALLFTIGKSLIGLYLGRAGATSAYGAAGSFVVLLLWIYYSAQILFFGAEITQVYANRYGSEVQPEPNAERITEAERANQGLTRREPKAGAGAAPGTAGAEGAVLPEPALAMVPGGGPLLDEDQTLAVVGPYEAWPPERAEAMVQGKAGPPPPLDREGFVVALLTFAAGLGAGALMASNSRKAARARRLSRAQRAA